MRTWTPLKFGIHMGLTLPEVLFKDPDWFFWAYYDGRLWGIYGVEGAELYWKARNIRIPMFAGGACHVEYLREPLTLKFAGFNLVAASDPMPPSCSDRLDLGLPQQMGHYDKAGYAIFIRQLKELLLPPKNRMSGNRAEAFYNGEGNFFPNPVRVSLTRPFWEQQKPLIP